MITVNALNNRFRAFMHPFCGPASKNLADSGRWYGARNNTDRSNLDAHKPMLVSDKNANTIC